MNRIFAKPGSSYKDLFTPEEISKFQKISVTEQSLSNCVNAMNFILMHIVAERNLTEVEETLSKNHLQPQKLEIFRNAWLQYGNDYSIKIREKPIAVQQVLHSFNWNISLQIDESRLPMKNVANFMNVEGKIDSADDLYSHDARNPAINYIFETQASGAGDQQIEKFSIKFQKAQLLEIFEQFENIQESLDKLM